MDGSLRARHLDNATKLAKGTVWPKLISRIPPGYEMVPTLGGQRVNTAVNHKVVRRLEAAAAAAHGALTTTVFDEHPMGTRDLDAPDLRGTVQELSQMMETAGTSETWSRPRFDRVVSHVRHHVKHARIAVDSARAAVARLADAEAAMADLMSRIEMLPETTPTAIERLAPLPDAPRVLARTSYTDFDPRETTLPPEPNPVIVETVGAGDGKRTRDARAR